MNKDLDALIAGIKALPADRDLSHIEPEVWARVDARATGTQRGGLFGVATNGQVSAMPVLSRSIAVALAVGLFVGVISVPRTSGPNELSVFSIEASYGPSGLLR